MAIEIRSAGDVQQELALRFRTRRLAMNLTQEGLAARSGVSWGSLKRFESSGLIAFDSLLKLSVVLDCLDDFDGLCVERESLKSLDEVLRDRKPRQKGRIR